jgi:Asp/Glu/Hydantoin racemase
MEGKILRTVQRQQRQCCLRSAMDEPHSVDYGSGNRERLLGPQAYWQAGSVGHTDVAIGRSVHEDPGPDRWLVLGSTAIYFCLVNEVTKARLGGLHSARLLLWSFDFAPIAEHQATGAWGELSEAMTDSARRLGNAGADALIIRSNTMHKLYDDVLASLAISVLHIA